MYLTNFFTWRAPKALGFKNWEDLRGKTVCGKQGAFHNQVVTERYGVNVVAWVYDDSSIGSDLSSGNFDDFEMPLKSEDDNPWAIAVPLAERDCIFGNFMSGLVFKMHRNGMLIELEKKWGIQPTQYLVDKAKTYGDWLAK